jgi:hypothetical protein
MDLKVLVLLLLEKIQDYNRFHIGEQEKTEYRGLAPNCLVWQRLTISYDNLEHDKQHIANLRSWLLEQLDQEFELSNQREIKVFYTVLNSSISFYLK